MAWLGWRERACIYLHACFALFDFGLAVILSFRPLMGVGVACVLVCPGSTSFWSWHIGFGEEKQEGDTAVMGRDGGGAELASSWTSPRVEFDLEEATAGLLCAFVKGQPRLCFLS